MKVLFWDAKDAGGDVAGHRIVKLSGDHAVVQSAAAGDRHVGVAGRAGAKDGERIEIARTGVAQVEYGGAVGRGDALTADADGKAVPVTDGGIHQHNAVGAAANANIAVTGLLATDILAAVVATDGTDPGAFAIHADGQIRCANATAGKRLIVTWRRPVGVVGTAEVAGVAGDVGEVLVNPAIF